MILCAKEVEEDPKCRSGRKQGEQGRTELGGLQEEQPSCWHCEQSGVPSSVRMALLGGKKDYIKRELQEYRTISIGL